MQWINFRKRRPAIGQLVVLHYFNNPCVCIWEEGKWCAPNYWYPLPEAPVPIFVNFTEGVDEAQLKALHQRLREAINQNNSTEGEST